jgi:hypothetical protein
MNDKNKMSGETLVCNVSTFNTNQNSETMGSPSEENKESTIKISLLIDEGLAKKETNEVSIEDNLQIKLDSKLKIDKKTAKFPKNKTVPIPVSPEKDKTIRKDRFGNPITKGRGKKQKISFLDKLPNTKELKNQPFQEVIQVISYKEYNIDTTTSIYVNMEKKKCCNCLLF